MSNFDRTMQFSIDNKDDENETKRIIRLACESMLEKGYDPVSQFIGYIISGDPTYITSYQNARTIVKRVDRDDLLEEFVRYYIDSLISK
ncbi:MAG: IreB family regulatory phosphoprotein [Eubacteriales bacterium]